MLISFYNFAINGLYGENQQLYKMDFRWKYICYGLTVKIYCTTEF